MTDITKIWALITIINVVCLLIHMWLSLRHRHEWGDWGEWMEDMPKPWLGEVRAVRYTTCEVCAEVRGQWAGQHRCLDIRNGKHCPHMGNLTGDKQRRIKRLEKELGL